MSDVQLIQTPCVFGENGNFLLERELGRGGMGGVYLGRDKMLDRPVAVKVMLKEFGSDAGFVERFKKEAQAAARLIHPNIAQVYSYGISDGMPYIAMELVAGGSLDQIMRISGANSDIPRIMKICEQVAQALRCAADQGLVHGDIKPENILLDANGNAKIVDFGLAAMQHDTDEIWGTPYYIAPEKVRKDAVDYRADMYSLGGTLYHALCGVAPFEGDDAMTVVRKRFEFIPRKPSEIRPELSSQIDALVMRMLAFNPGDRYPSFEALLADFKAVMTVGLSSSQILTPQGAPAKAAEAAVSGKKKLMIKSKKKLSIKRPLESSDDGGDKEEGAEDSNTGKTYNFKKMASSGSYDESDEEFCEDEESGGNVGAKVAIFAGVLIGAILLVGGGLWGIKSYSENKDKETQKAQVQKQIDADVEYLKAFREKSLKPYKESVAKLLKDVVDDTKESFDKYEEIYSDTDVVASIKEIRQPKTQVAAADAAAGAPVQNAAAGNNAEVKTEASPEKAEDNAGNEQQTAAAEESAETPQAVLPPSLEKMQKLWGEMTSLKGEIEAMNKEIGDLESKVDERLSKVAYNDAVKKDLMDFVNEVKPYETSYSKKISELRKTYKSCINEMKKICDQDLKRRTEEKEKARREKERREKEEQELREKEEKEAARKALLEKELEEAKRAFEDVTVQEHIRNFYWKGALDELERKISSFKTIEARIRVKDFAVKKVEMMRFVHERFWKASKNHVFSKDVFSGKLISDDEKRIEYVKNFANKRVVNVTEDKIVLLNRDGKGNESPYGWRTIYDRYPLIISLLRHKAEKDLSSTKKAEYNLGLAMILKTFCQSVEGVEAYYKKCVEEAVASNSYYKPMAEESFPEIDFSKIEAKKAENDF